MTTQEAMDALGITSQAELARVLGIGAPAVTQWGGIVPKLRRYEIQESSPVEKAADPRRSRGTSSRRVAQGDRHPPCRSPPDTEGKHNEQIASRT